MLGNLSQDSHKRDIGLTSTCGRSNQHRPRLLESNVVHDRLDLVQMCCRAECLMAELRHAGDLNQVCLVERRLRWRCDLNELPVIIVILSDL